MLISHALFKAALFLVVGIVDRSTGTRDIRKLSGVARRLPVVAGAAAVAAASMAAIPPLIGFTAKEAAFESLVYLLPDGDQTGIPPLPAFLLMGALVAGSALTVAYTLRFLWGAFGTKELLAPTKVAHEPAGFAAAPVILAAACLVGGFLGPTLTRVLDPLAEAAVVGKESHGIALWHGFSIPLALSVLALGVGVLLFIARRWIGKVQATFPRTPEAEEVYQAVMRGIDRAAVEMTARDPARLAADLSRQHHAGAGRAPGRRAAESAGVVRVAPTVGHAGPGAGGRHDGRRSHSGGDLARSAEGDHPRRGDRLRQRADVPAARRALLALTSWKSLP